MDADEIAAGRARWQARYDAARKRDADFTTLSGDRRWSRCTGRRRGDAYPGFERIGWPGEYPFTRGLYPTGYRGRTWTIRQFAGFGNAEQTNERYKMILGARRRRAVGRLRHADPDGPRLRRPAVARRGRPLRRRDRLGRRHGGPLRRHPARRRHHLDDDLRARPCRSSACTWSPPSGRASTLSMLNGTLQTDIFKEYIAQKEWLFPPEPHLRLIGDLMEYCAAGHPARTSRCRSPATTSARPARRPRRSWRTPSPTASATSSWACRAGWTSNAFAPGPVASSSTRTSTSSRRSPSSARPAGSGPAGCATSTARPREKAQWLRFHTQTAGVSLTAQQPYNNVVRTAVEALAAVLGGTNSLHTNALDETLALPSEQAAEIALRTQQVLMEETGVANVADPLGGSWYVEALTDRIEAEAERSSTGSGSWRRRRRRHRSAR